MLHKKRILLGVTGSIAAYKAALLTRQLVKAGAEVRVIMSRSATEFITPLTLATLSKHPVYSQFVKDQTGEWNNHVELGLWADALVIAPASANTLAKCTQGLCDNLLTAVYLSARCPVFFAPAMDLDMYQHPATRQNLQKLVSFGNHIIPAETGELASGLSGEGRMAEPEHIVGYLEEFFRKKGKLAGKTILITAGPTYEAIDPVRFVGNHSTGKMGFALAEAAAGQGAKVYLVSGPTQLSAKHPNIQLHRVTSAREMYEQASTYFSRADLTILAAAVADYTPKNPAAQKIKKKEPGLTLELVKTVDIAAALGKDKREGQLLVGFALETENERENALKKLERKNLDLIVLNSLRDAGAGFGHETNKVTIFDRAGGITELDLLAKQTVAEKILERAMAFNETKSVARRE